MKKSKKTSNKSTKHIETFLFCPKLGIKKQGDTTHFFSNLLNLDDQLAECVVFLNLPNALQYSRFMNREHVVLRAFIEHAAIEGRSHGLVLKKGFLTKHHIHGCFPGWAKGEVYMENPIFGLDPN
jgi:hypothetical protein